MDSISNAIRKELEEEKLSKERKARPDAPSDPTLWEADPFYEAAEALQEEMDKVHSSLRHWRQLRTRSARGAEGVSNNGQDQNIEDELKMSKCDVVTQCEDIRSQIEEFKEVIRISKLHPDRFHLSREELLRRQKFVEDLSAQVAEVVVEVESSQPAESVSHPGRSAQGGETSSPEGVGVLKPAGILIGEVGKPPKWEVIRLEEERKRKEKEGSSVVVSSYLLDEPLPKTLQQEIQYRLNKISRWTGDSEHRLLAAVGLLVLGVFGLHTFYGHDESLV